MKKILLFLCAVTVASGVSANDRTRYTIDRYDIKVWGGFNLGGTAPLSFPSQIRHIESFNPHLSLTASASAVYWFEPFGVRLELGFENKKMSSVAEVKEYAVNFMNSDKSFVEGLYTGKVRTDVNNEYITLCPSVAYRIIKPLCLTTGMYYGYLLNPSFGGRVYDGYLRSGEEGEETNIPTEANYNFSTELIKHDYGVHIGLEYDILRNLSLSLRMRWGAKKLFQQSFSGMGITLYNIYANFSVGYYF